MNEDIEVPEYPGYYHSCETSWTIPNAESQMNYSMEQLMTSANPLTTPPTPTLDPRYDLYIQPILDRLGSLEHKIDKILWHLEGGMRPVHPNQKEKCGQCTSLESYEIRNRARHRRSVTHATWAYTHMRKCNCAERKSSIVNIHPSTSVIVCSSCGLHALSN